MAFVNENFLKLSDNYLFADIAKRVREFKAESGVEDVISLGIGDVTQPLCEAAVKAIHDAAAEMSVASTFRGYGPEQGYDFLREAIVMGDFMSRGIKIGVDEVFVNDGAKSDTGNFQEIVGKDNIIALTDPVYPVYMDSNIMAGRRVVKLPCLVDNGFVPELPEEHVDVIYLCYPNNPTGTVLKKDDLRKWVDYAIEHGSLIFYDAAYEAFISNDDVPHSIYEIDGAERVAVEFHSFSKTAGFTGVRCGYTVVPKEVTAVTASGKRVRLNPLWNRRQSTKFNGTSYLSQRAAEAVYSPEGREQTRAAIEYYMRNASIMGDVLRELGFDVYGGEDAPYLWVKTPENVDSWSFFDRLLRKAHVVCTPGVGFGQCGDGFVRLTAFGQHEQTLEALRRVREWLER